MRRCWGQFDVPAAGWGMTLIELLVSLAVMSIIIVAFGTIMTQTQKVVDKSNTLMQANATASAVAQVIREDIASLYKDGFLDTHGGTVCMDFTAVGTYRSVFDPNVCSNAARIFYFLDPNAPTDPNKQTLFRCAFLLCPQGPPSGGPDANGDDVLYNRYLTCYQDGNSGVYGLDLSNMWGSQFPSPVTLPITEPNQVDKAWPVLATKCTRFAVSFLNPNTGKWDSNSSNGYAWVPSNPSSPTWWPRAIKVEFRLKTGDRLQDFIDYEVICPVPQ